MHKGLEILIRAGWPPAGVFVLHGLYMWFLGHPPWLDVVMHPLGGLAIAYFFHVALRLSAPVFGEPSALGHSLQVLGLAFIAANLWEFAEFLLDTLRGYRVQMTITETMTDLLLGTGAATVFAIFVYWRSSRKETADELRVDGADPLEPGETGAQRLAQQDRPR